MSTSRIAAMDSLAPKTSAIEAQSVAKTGSVALILGFRGQLQAQDTWCWAAAAASVDEYYAWQRNQPEKARSQCQFIQEELGRYPCSLCPPKKSPRGDCQKNGCSTYANDEYGWLNHALHGVQMYRGYTLGAVDFATCQAEVDNGRPLGVRVKHSDGTDHILVIIGYDTNIPWCGRSLVSYNGWEIELGKWTHTIFTRQQ